MADVRMRNVEKSFGETHVIRDVSLEIRDGEFVVFVGPSGCGKSTLLRMIAGLEDITAGELTIGAQRMNEVPPAQRGIAMVFQSYALYPHMSVFDNMAFGLKLAHVPKDRIDADVRNAAKILHIDHLLDRKPKALSGGQRQRVAIGRAIVRKPQVFLFDEPLSNLDAALRVKMRYEFARLHEDLKTTMVYVTHDQVEAMTLADRIVVLSAGRVEQVGAPMELYNHPANLFVAGFIGSPKMNFVPVEIVECDASRARVRLRSGETVDVAVDASRAKPGDQATLGFRPGQIELEGGANPLACRVVFVEAHGNTTVVYLQHPGSEDELTLELQGERAIDADSPVTIHLAPDNGYLFDAQGLAFRRIGQVTAGARH